MTTLVKSLVTVDNGQISIIPEARNDVRRAVVAFLDMASTATGQKTYYNTKKDQKDAMNDIHNAVFSINRGLYLAMLTLPGVMDNSIQSGITKIMKESRDDSSILTPNQEAEIVKLVSMNLKPTRLLKMLRMFKENRINKRSVRTFILSCVLGNKSLPWWCLKYRNLVKDVLRHAWGNKYSPVIVRAIVSKGNVTDKDRNLVKKCVDKYTKNSELSDTDIYESIAFAFGANFNFTNKLFKAFEKSKTDISAGKLLPPEVLEGIRGRYHKNTPKDKIFELTKNTATDKQKLKVQRKAKEANVEVKFNARNLDAVSLYVYALEMGMNEDIRKELDVKASIVAKSFPLKYDKAEIIVDNSASMGGTDANKNKPLAISLAMRDMLKDTCSHAGVRCTNGSVDALGMTNAGGDTSLALSVAEALQNEPDVLYIITDGYENAPAGRVHEVIDATRKIGINIPIYQFNPVMAAESSGVRSLSSHLSTMPVSKPEGIGLSLIRAAINQDVDKGLQALINSSMLRIAG